MTMRKIATIIFLDTGCLILSVYCFLFGQKSIYFVGRQGWAKFFDWQTLPPMSPGFVADLRNYAKKFHLIRREKSVIRFSISLS